MVGNPLQSIKATIDDITVNDPYGGDGLDYGDFTAGEGVSGQPFSNAQDTAEDVPSAADTVASVTSDAAGNAAESVSDALPWEVKGIAGLAALALLAVAFGQIVTFNVGGGS